MSDELNAYFDEVEARFDGARDFTVGLEEEFQILDPATQSLAQGFIPLRDSAPPRLRDRIAGELIESEIEVPTPKARDFAGAARQLLLNRKDLFFHAESQGYALGVTGTHPWSSWKDQRIIDTPHYRLVEDLLKYVAWRNNTWSCHVHVGIRGKDRAIAVCDAMRQHLPHLLALSANSPFIEGVWTQLHSARVQTFVRMFPRCGIPDIFGSWAEHRAFYELLVETNSIREFTQVWWSIRPHHRFGTVEVRICDAQTEPWQTLAVLALAVGLVATMARAYDEGRLAAPLATRYVEENLWRGIRYGLDGKMIDFAARSEITTIEAVHRMVETAAPMGRELGIEPYLDAVERMLREGNGAQRQAAAYRDGASIEEVYGETVARAHESVRAIGDLAEEMES